MRTYCPQCGMALSADDEHVGRQIQCPGCGARFVLAPPAGTAGDVRMPGPVPTAEDWAPDIVLWVREQHAERSAPIGVGDFVLGPDGLAFVCRSSVPTKVIKGDTGVGLGASVMLGGAIGGAIAAYRMMNAPSYPGVTIQTTDESRLRRIFKKAAKKREAEGAMPLGSRLARNQGSQRIPYAQIQAIEIREAGAVRLRMADRAYYLTVHRAGDAFGQWLMRLGTLSDSPCLDSAAVQPSADRFRVTCAGCGREVSVPRSRADEPVKCMYCGTLLPEPAPEDQAASPPADGAAAPEAPRTQPREHITGYLVLMAQGQLAEAGTFVGALTVDQRRAAAEALRQIQPDPLAHPDLADVPPPVIRRFMNQMRNELQRQGTV